MRLVNMYDDGGGCSGKGCCCFEKNSATTVGGLRLDGAVHRPGSIAFYVFYWVRVHTIGLLFCYWHQTAAISKRLAERGGNAKKTEICPGRHPNLRLGERRPVICHHAT